MASVKSWQGGMGTPSPAAARILILGGAFAAFLSLCSCTSGEDAGKREGNAAVLRMQVSTPPFSLNPALASGGRTAVFTALAYDPLIYLTGDGRLIPDLAESWRYVSGDNRVFEMKLRRGVKFSDGTPLNARAVAASMNYFLHANGPMLRTVGKIDEISAVGDDRVRVTWAQPNPNAALVMTQYYGIGMIIAPSGVANPAMLQTASAGTGQFIYRSSASVSNNSYFYSRNPGYWNPAAQQYETVTVKIITDPNSVIAAMQSGQLDFANGSPQTAEAATQAGLRIVAAPYYNWALLLVDREGKVSPPLADRRVRQAIALSFERELLAKALGNGFAAPSGQVLLEGADGYVGNFGYGHDLRRARQLMAEAGYSRGFTLPVLAQSLTDPNALIAQAIAGSLADIGIKVELKVESTGLAQFNRAMLSKKYPAIVFPTSGADMAQLASLVLPPDGGFNPFGTADGQINALLGQAYLAGGEKRSATYRQITRRLGELAWIAPIFGARNIFYVNSAVANVAVSLRNPSPIPTGPDPSVVWKPVPRAAKSPRRDGAAS